jgi:hypothetical protein
LAGVRVGFQQSFLLNVFRIFLYARNAKCETKRASLGIVEIAFGNLARRDAFTPAPRHASAIPLA